MTEISLNILDIAENSVTAGAKLICITVDADFSKNCLTVIISDNGCGMTSEQIEKVTDPFYTTRTTRKVGLGVPFFKAAAKTAGGSFKITSKVGVGTEITATFEINNIDRMPLGDIVSTIHTLVIQHLDVDFLFTYKVNKKSFVMNTAEFREILGDIPFNTPDVSNYIRNFLRENVSEVNGENTL